MIELYGYLSRQIVLNWWIRISINFKHLNYIQNILKKSLPEVATYKQKSKMWKGFFIDSIYNKFAGIPSSFCGNHMIWIVKAPCFWGYVWGVAKFQRQRMNWETGLLKLPGLLWSSFKKCKKNHLHLRMCDFIFWKEAERFVLNGKVVSCK